MSGTGAIKAGGAFVTLSLEDSNFSQGLKKAQTKLRSFSDGIKQFAKAATDVSLVLGQSFAGMYVYNAFASFDLKMRQVAAITKATTAQLKALRAEARKLGRETSFTTQQVADGMMVLSRMGFSTKDVLKATRPVMDFARAIGEELPVAAQVAGNNMRVFQKDASDLVEITDVITSTVNGAAINLGDYAEAAQKAGPTFAQVGQDIYEMSAAIGVLGNMGIRGSIAGNALARAMRRVAHSDVQKMLHQYNIDFKDIHGNILPISHIIANIARSIKGLPQDVSLRLFEELFEVRGATAMLALTVDASSIDAFLERLYNSQGEVEKIASNMDKGAFGAMKIAFSALYDVAIELGEVLSELFVPLVKDIQYATSRVTAFLQSFRELAQLITGTIGSVLGMGLAFSGIAKGLGFIKLIMSPFKGIQNTFGLMLSTFRDTENEIISKQGKEAYSEGAVEENHKNKEYKEAQKRAQSLKEALDKERKDSEDVLKRASDNEKAIRQKRKELRDLTTVAGEKDSAIAREQNALEDYKTQSQTRINAIAEQGKQRQEELRAINQEISERKKNINKMTRESNDLARDMQKAEARIAEVREAEHGLQIVDEKRIQKEIKRSNVTKLLNQQKSIARKHVKAQQEYATVSQNYQTATTVTLGTLRRQASEKRIGAGGRLMNFQKNVLPGLEQQKLKLEESIAEYENILKGMPARLNVAEREYETASKEYDMASQRYPHAPTGTMITNLHQQNKHRQEAIAFSNASIAEDKAAIEKLSGRAADVETGKETLKNSLAQIEEEKNAYIQASKQKISATRAELAEIQKKQRLTHSEVAELEASADISRKNAREANSRIKAREKEFQKAQQQADKLKKQADEVSDKLNKIYAQSHPTTKEDYAEANLAEGKQNNLESVRNAQQLASQAKQTLKIKDAELSASQEAIRNQGMLFNQGKENLQQMRERAHQNAIIVENELQGNNAIINSIRQKYAVERAEIQKKIAAKKAELEIVNQTLEEEKSRFASGEGSAATVKKVASKRSRVRGRIGKLNESLENLSTAERDESAPIVSQERVMKEQLVIERQHIRMLEEKQRVEQERLRTLVQQKQAIEQQRQEAQKTINDTSKTVNGAKNAVQNRLDKRSRLAPGARTAETLARATKIYGMRIAFEGKFAEALKKTNLAQLAAAKMNIYRLTTGKQASAMVTAKIWSEVVAIKAATAATALWAAAVNFLKANWLAIAVVAVTALYQLYRNMLEKAARKMQDLADASQKLVDNLRELQNELKEDDRIAKDYFKFLQSMNLKPERSPAEIASIKEIVAFLNKKHNLQIEVDDNGSIKHLQESMDIFAYDSSLNAKNNLQDIIDAEAKAVQDQIKALPSAARTQDDGDKTLAQLGVSSELKQIGDLRNFVDPNGINRPYYQYKHVFRVKIDGESIDIDNLPEKLRSMSNEEIENFIQGLRDAIIFDKENNSGAMGDQLSNIVNSLKSYVKEREKLTRTNWTNPFGEAPLIPNTREPEEVVEEARNEVQKQLEENAKDAMTAIEKEIYEIKKAKKEYEGYVNVLQTSLNNEKLADKARLQRLREQAEVLHTQVHNAPTGSKEETELLRRLRTVEGELKSLQNKSYETLEDEIEKAINGLTAYEDKLEKVLAKYDPEKLIADKADERKEKHEDKERDKRISKALQDSKFGSVLSELNKAYQDADVVGHGLKVDMEMALADLKAGVAPWRAPADIQSEMNKNEEEKDKLLELITQAKEAMANAYQTRTQGSYSAEVLNRNIHGIPGGYQEKVHAALARLEAKLLGISSNTSDINKKLPLGV